MVLAAIDLSPERNTWYSPEKASVFGYPVKMDPTVQGKPALDPLNETVYPDSMVESFWTQAEEHTRAKL